MNDAQLRCFHVAAIEGSFSRAAARLRLSQPTVSTQIRILEEGYKVQLFRRHGRRVELTDEGRELRAITLRLYAAQEEARSYLSQRRELIGGLIRIGAVGPHHVMPVLREFQDRHPQVDFTLKMGNSNEIFQAVLDRDVDIGVLAEPRMGHENLYLMPLRTDHVGFAVSARHPWSEKQAVTLPEAAQETLLLREAGSVTRSVFMKALTEADLKPAKIIEIHTREAIKEAVAQGFGAAPILHSEASYDSRVKLIPLAAPSPSFTEYVICQTEMRGTATVRAFIAAAGDVAARWRAAVR
ncbi:MAG: LysR family transcriptional regulator [Rhodospirillaceae bacterium]|nr:MAG: LysR family transcriptional regulator [Rhodospirillaceae bacterium]